MLAKIYSAAIIGLDARIIEVEVDASYGLRCFNIVGLPDKSVEESQERVATAVKASGFPSPHSQPVRVLVNLAPADLKKEGSLYDLPIALGYLSAAKQLKFNPDNRIFVGELALNGELRPIKGALSIALMSKEKGIGEVILPKANAAEASLAKGPKIIGVENLKEAIDYILGKKIISPFLANFENLFEKPDSQADFNWIRGQEYTKRALEIAAAGGHNLLMQGPPGVGKSLLAKALPSILPPLSFEESLEVTKIYSIAGLLPNDKPLMTFRPFRSPHHTTSETALIGGGNPPRAGEITLAHRGILFLDEFPEFHRDALESLRQPLEEGQITVLRAKHHMTLPAQFMLIAATNPCPCGNYGNPEKNCTCSSSQIAMYKRKLSGPLMDRIDLFVEVPSLKYEKLAISKEDLTSLKNADSDSHSLKIKERIQMAREIQSERFKDGGCTINSGMQIPQIKKYCQVDPGSENVLKKSVDSGQLSARGYHRVLKIARTIADLGNSENIAFNHVSEALMYRLRGVDA